MLNFLFDVFVIAFCITWFVFMSWFIVWCWLYAIGSYLEHRIEVHWRMMDRFSETTNYPMYDKHRKALDKNRNRLNRLSTCMDFF